MSTTIQELSAALEEVAAAAKEVGESQAELNRREQELAEAMEAFTIARQEGAIWSEATAARDRYWRVLIGQQLAHLQPNSAAATVLRRLEAMATGDRQMEG